MKIAELPAPESTKASAKSSKDVVLSQAANELVFGVVGHVGSGTSEIARQLEAQLEVGTLIGGAFDATILKASGEILNWLKEQGETPPERVPKQLECVERLQNLGDQCRESEKDPAAVARRLVEAMRQGRASKQGQSIEDGQPVTPDGTRRAWVLDSLRHPSEVELLRHIYQDAFVLVGVVCDEDRRRTRLRDKYSRDGSDQRISEFMRRDADDGHSFGQKVADTFHMSDFFVNNTENRSLSGGGANVEWDVAEQLGRLIKLLTHADIVRPTSHETAMHAAYGSQVRSACLSRQVGAALVGRGGELMATGTNEVPRPGGGVYGTVTTPDDRPDDRCALRRDENQRFCSNTKLQVEIIDDLIEGIERAVLDSGGKLSKEAKLQLRLGIRRTRVGSLIEFSRAIHAEMDVLLCAARQGKSVVGGILYVTTFPCHSCARHIVAAGIDEVQFIEPYPKSLAVRLHDDAICVSAGDRNFHGQRRVLFRPFTGVAPRLYRRAFTKDRDLKDRYTGAKQIELPEWGTPWHLRRMSYVALEAELSRKEEGDA